MKLAVVFLLFPLSVAGADTQSLRSLVQQAQAAEQNNRLDDAVALYQRILRIRPGWASAELNLGLVLHSRGNYTEAIRILTEALRHQPDLHSARLFRGASYYQTARPEEAVRDLTEYLRHQPDDPEALPILAGAHLAAGDPAEAAVAYATLARVTREAAAYFRLADCYARLAGRVLPRLSEEHAKSFRTGLTENREAGCQVDGDLVVTNVRCAAVKGDFEGASRTLIQVLEAPVQTSDAAARLGETLRLLAQLAAAKVLSVAPESAWASLLRAQAADEANQTGTAEQEYKLAVSSADATPDMYVRYGQFQCKHGQLDAGLASYEHALQLDRTTPGVSGLIGEVHLLQNRPQRAIEYLRTALQANPRETQSRLYLAQALNRTGRATEALQILEAAPDDPDGRIHYALGRAYMQQGDSEKAQKAMDVFRQRRGPVKP